MAAALSKELLQLVMQFLKEEKYEEAVHMLEQQTGLFFDLNYFERLMMAGNFDEADQYLSGFTNLHENRNSMKIFFEIRKHKYLEALDRKDMYRAVEILRNDLKVFKEFNPEIYVQLMELLTLDDFRENEQLKDYSNDTMAQRTLTFLNIKRFFETNTAIQQNITFPSIDKARLRMLINQSINWQHHNCKSPRSNPDIRTIFVDHTCEPSNGARTPSPANNSLMASTSNRVAFPTIPSTYIPFQAGVAPPVSTLTGWPANLNLPMPLGALATAAVVSNQNTDASLKRPRTPTPTKGGTDHEYIMKRFRASEIDQVLNSKPTHYHNIHSENNLPKTVVRSLHQVVRSLHQGSKVVSMDFHPHKPTMLLVGTDVGDIGIWEVVSCEKLAHNSFRVWEASKLKMVLEESHSKESLVSVNKCIWSSDGVWIGVAFSKNIVHTYHFTEAGQLRQHLQIDAHIGSVNDISLNNHNKRLSLITCGDDKIIKVWDARSGDIQYTFEGHEAPVYAICPHHKQNIEFIISTSVDGKVKTWLYDEPRSESSYEAPGHGLTKMTYSADGSRLFSCGTYEGESYLVEWNDNDGTIKRTYSGLGRRSAEVVMFDTAKKLLAAGDDNEIKFWDMDNSNILSKTNADGGLPARPSLRFNKEGSLLAVSTSDNGIKVLANQDGIQFLQTLENRRVLQELAVRNVPNINLIDTVGHVAGKPDISERTLPRALTVTTIVDSNRMVDMKQNIAEEAANKSNNWKFAEVTHTIQCRSMKLQDPLSTGKIVRLQYASSAWLLALDTNAKHKLWKWKSGELNCTATTRFPPEFWQPTDASYDMRNDTNDRSPGEFDPCMTVTKNSSYLASCSGGKVSLFNLKTFKMMVHFTDPPATTFLAFHPKDSNVVAIGREDGIILFFNLRNDEMKVSPMGHENRITGIAFSEVLNVMVSAGADGQLCVWGIDTLEKQKSKSVDSKAVISPSSLANIRIQFHKDQVHLLVVLDNQIAIYDAYQLERLCHWSPQDSMTAPISSATYSCDCLLVYASFCDGSVGVFDANVLKPCRRIAPSALMPGVSSGNTYPVVIAAHPSEPNQFAIGLTDGCVHVIEPAETEGNWGVGPSENGVAGSNDTFNN